MGDLSLEMVRAVGGPLDTYTICVEHGEITGLVDDPDGRRWQRCDCHPERGGVWPATADIHRRVDLCWTCAGQLIRAGSRWNVFHCDRCRTWLLERREAGLPVPPLGRHSIMNQVPVDPDDPDVVGGIRRMASSIDDLHAWRRSLVRQVIDRETPLVEYLARVEPVDPEAWVAHVTRG